MIPLSRFLLIPAVSAGLLAQNCTVTSGAEGGVRADGVTELIGDIVLACTGLTPTPADSAPQVKFTINWNTSLTSGLLDPSGLSEVMVLVNEPQPAAMRVGVPGELQAGDNAIFCRNTGISQVSCFAPLPPVPPGSTRTFRITNVRVNAAQLSNPTGLSTPATVVANILVSTGPPDSPSITSLPPVIAARLLESHGWTTEPAQRERTLPPPSFGATAAQMRFREGFPTCFRRANRNVTPANPDAAPTNQPNDGLTEQGFVPPAEAFGERTRLRRSFFSRRRRGTLRLFRITGVPTGVEIGARVEPASNSSGWAGRIYSVNGDTRVPAPDAQGWTNVSGGGTFDRRAVDVVIETLRSDPALFDEIVCSLAARWSVDPGAALISASEDRRVIGPNEPRTVPPAFFDPSGDLAECYARIASIPPDADEPTLFCSGFQHRYQETRDRAPFPIFNIWGAGPAAFGLVFPQDSGGLPLTFDAGAGPMQFFLASQSTPVSGITFGLAAPTTPQARLNWLEVEQFGGTTPVTFRVAMDGRGLQPGTYSGSINVLRTGAAPAAIPMRLRVPSGPRPQFQPYGVTNAGSYRSGFVSPGEAVVIFGALLGPPNLTLAGLGTDGRRATEVGGTRVLFNGVPAPMIYAAAGQVSCFVPYGAAAAGDVRIEVEYQGTRSLAVRVPVALSKPALISADSSGSGLAAALNQDNTFNSQTGSLPGDVVVLFGVGGPQTNPPSRDGETYQSPIPAFTDTVKVFWNGVQAPASDVLYAGPAPGLTHGVWQLNVRTPAGAARGSRQHIMVQIGDSWTQPGVLVAIR